MSLDIFVIGGPNGAGKSTLAPLLLRDRLHLRDFVNADTIALGLSAFSPESAALEAGRVMLKRLDELADQWMVIENSVPMSPAIVAHGGLKQSTAVIDTDGWSYFLERTDTAS